ncbi:hypothetical protein [Listeria booriae]|uniref:hypothetical protein n=1 Tax=Listeria booriae TaxID=1552123 RepID=UPI0016271C9B|nr:hypothetical protein [Listeria booriae]MBC2173951.1 hypothetical protein [Listeria booriae]
MIYKLRHHADKTVGFETEAPISSIVSALEMAIATVVIYYGPSADLSNAELVAVLRRGLSNYGVEQVETDKQYFGVEIDMFDLYESIAADIYLVEKKRHRNGFYRGIADIACSVYMEVKE